MRLGEMAQKQLLEACHSSGKSVAFSCFGSIRLTISTIDARRKNVNRYDRPKKLRAASHLWVRMHMQFGFQVLLHVPFFFSNSISAIDLLTEFKPSELQFGISRVVWRRKFETINSRIAHFLHIPTNGKLRTLANSVTIFSTIKKDNLWICWLFWRKT